MALSKGIFIVAAKRTPFGAFGGSLKDLTATTLQELATRAALTSGNVNPEIVDSIIVGNVIQSSTDAAYVARHVGLRCGLPVPTPALTINRLCGSGFQSVVNGAHEILLGEASVVLCGGTESMSQAPFAIRDVRFGTKLGMNYKLEDTLWEGLTDQYIKTPMGMTAENLAKKYDITREDADKMALRSQQGWKKGQEEGAFKDEIEPVKLKTRKGEKVVDVDEHPKPQTTAESLAKLPPVFSKTGTINAGNASGVCDGAGAIIIAGEDAVKQHGLTPLARVVGWSVSGCDPSIMGIGPVPAIRNLLKKTGKELKDIDTIEVNEAFAPQFLAVEKELGLDPARTNVNGGAIAIGHPLAASGSRILAHLTYDMRRRKLKTSIGSACIGGGQGIAVLLENCS